MPADKWQDVNIMATDSMVFFICSAVAVTGDGDLRDLKQNGGRH